MVDPRYSFSEISAVYWKLLAIGLLPRNPFSSRNFTCVATVL